MDTNNMDFNEIDIHSSSDLFSSAVRNDDGAEVVDEYGLEFDEGMRDFDNEIDNEINIDDSEVNLVNEDRRIVSIENDEGEEQMMDVVRQDDDTLYNYEAFSDMSLAKDDVVCEIDDHDKRDYNEMLYVGMIFKDKGRVDKAVREFSLKNRVNCEVIKSGKKLLYIGCKHRKSRNCPWYLRAIIKENDSQFTVTRLGPPHSCKTTTEGNTNCQLNAKMIALRIRDKIRNRLTFLPSHIMDEMKDVCGIKMDFISS